MTSCRVGTLKTLLWILGSVVLFGLLLKPLGMVLSVFVLVLVSSMASHEFSWKGATLNGVVARADQPGRVRVRHQPADAGVACTSLPAKEPVEMDRSPPCLGFSTALSLQNLAYAFLGLHAGHADRRAAGHRPRRHHRDAAARDLRAAPVSRR